MSYYGVTPTKQGRELIAKLIAGEMPMVITRIMFGEGTLTTDTKPADLTDLIKPVAAGTSTEPYYDGDTVHMTLEFRSDLNGGLEHGFWLSEFSVWALDPDADEVMIYYGTLGDYPQWVSAFSKGGIDVRRFPVSIVVGEGATVVIDFSPESFLTKEDLDDYVTTTLLPLLLEEMQRLIDIHDVSQAAHPYIQGLISDVDARLSLMELMYGTEVKGNPFVVTFGTLTGVTVTGVWNQPQKRIEF